MSAVKPTKPIVATIITLIWLGCFVFLDTGPHGFMQSFFYFNEVSASAVKWTVILIVAVTWLAIQLFLAAPPESSRLALVLSGSILWLGLLLFFNFSDPGYGGPVAFFALVGGLVAVIAWTRYLADEF